MVRHVAPFSLSVEPTKGKTFRQPASLGNDLAVARDEAAKEFHSRNRYEMWTLTVAVLDAKGRVVDVFDGHKWSSDL